MIEKIFKIILFIIYTYLIYQTYLFIVVILSLGWNNLDITLIRINKFFDCFFFFSGVISELSKIFLEDKLRIDVFILPILYLSLFIPWYKRQTIFRAWGVALIGFLFGPGLIFLETTMAPGDGGHAQRYWFPTFILLNLFYISIFVCNYLQKIYYPDDKFANTLRTILKWPCLRT